MTRFKIVGQENKDIILAFLNSVTAQQVSDHVLSQATWGSSDPIAEAMDYLKELARCL